MLSHNQAKFLASLQVKKYRQKYRNFLVEGDKMVRELLGQKRIGVVSVFALERWMAENADSLLPFSGKLNPVTEAELAKISTLTSPNQVLAVAEIPLETCNFQLQTSECCFYLDGIQDPGNLGSILRVADWFGFPAVFCSPDCADIFSPKVVQASMGAIFRVQALELGLPELLESAPKIPVIGAVLDGENIFEVKLPASGLIVIGNEGRGISPEIEKILTLKLSVPRYRTGKAESLNASVAAGIFAALIRER